MNSCKIERDTSFWDGKKEVRCWQSCVSQNLLAILRSPRLHTKYLEYFVGSKERAEHGPIGVNGRQRKMTGGAWEKEKEHDWAFPRLGWFQVDQRKGCHLSGVRSRTQCAMYTACTPVFSVSIDRIKSFVPSQKLGIRR